MSESDPAQQIEHRHYTLSELTEAIEKQSQLKGLYKLMQKPLCSLKQRLVGVRCG